MYASLFDWLFAPDVFFKEELCCHLRIVSIARLSIKVLRDFGLSVIKGAQEILFNTCVATLLAKDTTKEKLNTT